ncbi:MAG: hypothetical protein LBU34_09455 [Planctomycetaceae bacterium]|nr:hypothetical protein [Planctomycetaceae bacterium]
MNRFLNPTKKQEVGNRSPNDCVGDSRPAYFLLSASRQRNCYGERLPTL